MSSSEVGGGLRAKLCDIFWAEFLHKTWTGKVGEGVL